MIQIHLDPAESLHLYKSTVCPGWAGYARVTTSAPRGMGMPVNIDFLSFPKYYKNSFMQTDMQLWLGLLLIGNAIEEEMGILEEGEGKNMEES